MLATLQPTRTESRLELLFGLFLRRLDGDREAAREALLAQFTEDEWTDVLYDWEWNRRDGQSLPDGDWMSCVVQAGRGWGKSFFGMQAVRKWAENQEPHPIYLIGPTSDDVRSVMIEGAESGILAHSRPDFRPRFEPSKRKLTWPNGVVAYTRSGDRPDRLRGPQGSKAWVDELCAMRYAGEVRDQLDMMIRLGDPRVLYTTTPRPTKVFREIIAERDTVVRRGRTKENLRHLSEKFMERVYRKHDGTRLGRQELDGDVIDDNPGALWKLAQIELLRRRSAPELLRVVVAVDPSGGSKKRTAAGEASAVTRESDEVGIGAAGVGMCRCKQVNPWDKPELHGFVLEDETEILSPGDWAARVAKLYHKVRADRVVAETNFGGEMVESNIRTLGDSSISFKAVTASRGKAIRAEPVAALYEQGKIHHVGAFAKLEDEMCLAAGTRILTARGQIRIEDVTTADVVLTRVGWRSVVRAGMTGVKQTLTMRAEDGTTLRGTGNHPIWTSDRDFTPLVQMSAGSRILGCRTCETHSWNSTVGDISGTSATDTGSRAGRVESRLSCTSTSGRRPMGNRPADGTSITETKIEATTICPICALCPRPSTSGSMVPPDASPGALKPSRPRNEPNGARKRRAISSAGNAAPDFSPSACELLTVVDVAAPRRGADPEPVFNLEVAGQHEYFANGILVHNCQWNPLTDTRSPNRVDWLVWAFTELMLEGAQPLWTGGRIGGQRRQ